MAWLPEGGAQACDVGIAGPCASVKLLVAARNTVARLIENRQGIVIVPA